MGKDTCKTPVIFLYLHPQLSPLDVCLLWQWLFSDQFCVALASAPSLYSAHSGCIPACCQTNKLVPVAEREKERWVRGAAEGKEHWGRKSFILSMRKTWYEFNLLHQQPSRSRAYPTVATVMLSLLSLGKLFKNYKKQNKQFLSSGWSQ